MSGTRNVVFLCANSHKWNNHKVSSLGSPAPEPTTPLAAHRENVHCRVAIALPLSGGAVRLSEGVGRSGLTSEDRIKFRLGGVF